MLTSSFLCRTKHFFLDLPALTPQLQEYITRASDQGGWSSNCLQVWKRCMLEMKTVQGDRYTLCWCILYPSMSCVPHLTKR
jgi:methionyl-tRNA synthetase